MRGNGDDAQAVRLAGGASKLATHEALTVRGMSQGSRLSPPE